MTRGRKRKSDKLPKYGTTTRNALISILTDLPAYKSEMEKGRPLFSGEDLGSIASRYEGGMTWDEIDRELSGKGIILKKATFRKYIQEGNLSEAIEYRNTDKGRVAVFPADIVAHINFIQYFYKVDDGTLTDNMLGLLIGKEINYQEAIESRLEWRDNLYAALMHHICFDDADLVEAIDEVLSTRPGDRVIILKMIESIESKFHASIDVDVKRLFSFLSKKKIPLAESIKE